MKNILTKNAPASGDLVSDYLDTAYDNVKLVADNMDAILAISADVVATTDINTLAGLNTVVADATLGDSGDFATAAQGAKADTATQPGDLGTASAQNVGYFATAAQGTLANTAVQPGAIDSLAELNAVVLDATIASQAYVDASVADVTSYVGQNLQTGTSYELILGDAGKIIEMNNASANSLNIPANAAVAFPVDTRIDVIQYGAGTTTITITTDTLTGAVVSGGQYNAMSLWKRSATEWVVIGGTTP